MSEDKKPKTSKAQQRAVNKYIRDHYDRLNAVVTAGKKGVYKEAAKAGGFASLNEFIEKMLDAAAETLLIEKVLNVENQPASDADPVAEIEAAQDAENAADAPARGKRGRKPRN